MSIDSVLGDYENRYFGAGHKRTKYYLEKAFVDNEDAKEGIARIEQINGWSKKHGC